MNTKQKIFRALEILLLLLVAVCIVWLYISVSGTVADILLLEEEGRFEEAKQFLRGEGSISAPILFLLQMFSMLIAFVPPELLQISAGVALPFYIAILLMLLGALVGQSLVFLLVI